MRSSNTGSEDVGGRGVHKQQVVTLPAWLLSTGLQPLRSHALPPEIDASSRKYGIEETWSRCMDGLKVAC